MFAIYKRELKSYFRTFIGFLFIAVTLFFMGLYFTVYNLMNGYPYFSYTIASIVVILLLTVPVLTMRILAEEKRSKTDQLILTAPVSVGGIVMGKFLALLTIYAIPVGIGCLYPLMMTRYGTVPMGDAYLSLLAFFLFGMTTIAIGLLISSLTESQVIAAVLSFGVLFIGYMMDSICSIISSTGNLLTKVLRCFDLYTPFSQLLNGTLQLSAVVYYITLTAFILFLTVQSIQKRRYSVSVKNFSISAYSTGMIAVALVVVVMLNMILGEMPSSWTAIDLTQQKLYSLTDQTKEYVKNIGGDVTIYVLSNEESQDTTLQQTLQRYDDLSDRITVTYVDPAVNPTFHKQYTSDSIGVNSLILVSEKRSKVVDYNDIYETSYEMDYTTYNYSATTTGYDGEGQITSALDYVLSDDIPKLYATTGHKEGELSATFTTALEKENIEFGTLNLMDVDVIPEDTACLFINGALTDFSVDDKDKVIAYLEQGGKVVLVTGYGEQEMPNIKALAEYMGLELVDGLVVEQTKENYYRNPYYILPTQEPSVYTASLYGKTYIFAPFAQGIRIMDENAESMSYQSFLTTSDSAFSKVDAASTQDYTMGEKDLQGPFVLGVEAVKTLAEGEATMVVYGCEQLFTDEANAMVSGANQVLFTNTMGAFVDHETSVSVPVKSYEVSYLTANQLEVLMLGLVTTILLPLSALIMGFVIWFKRRKR